MALDHRNAFVCRKRYSRSIARQVSLNWVADVFLNIVQCDTFDTWKAVQHERYVFMVCAMPGKVFERLLGVLERWHFWCCDQEHLICIDDQRFGDLIQERPAVNDNVGKARP